MNCPFHKCEDSRSSSFSLQDFASLIGLPASIHNYPISIPSCQYLVFLQIILWLSVTFEKFFGFLSIRKLSFLRPELNSSVSPHLLKLYRLLFTACTLAVIIHILSPKDFLHVHPLMQRCLFLDAPPIILKA